MKRINIFKPGKHTSAGGITLEFSEDLLKQAVDAYDPAIHEAPIVVGHPQDNHPAYGWVGKMEYTEEGVDAIPDQVDPDFAELVTSGRFKKVSASWYTPDSPANPKPGSYYLRHVGFLGAQPPAIKGLKAVAFNEAEEGVVEFSDAWDTQSTAGIFRRLREFIIDKFSKEDADNIIPDYAITDLENSARRQLEKPEASDNEVAYNEAAPNQPDEENPMELEQLKTENADLKTKLADLESKVESFSERETAIAQREAEIKKAKLVEFVEGAIKAGKVAPAEKENLIAFMESLDDSKTVDFAEGDAKQQLNALEAFQKLINGQPTKVEFGERTGANHEDTEMTPEQLSDRAVAYRKAQAEKGKSVSFTEAVAAVEAGNDQ